MSLSLKSAKWIRSAWQEKLKYYEHLRHLRFIDIRRWICKTNKWYAKWMNNIYIYIHSHSVKKNWKQQCDCWFERCKAKNWIEMNQANVCIERTVIPAQSRSSYRPKQQKVHNQFPTERFHYTNSPRGIMVRNEPTPTNKYQINQHL